MYEFEEMEDEEKYKSFFDCEIFKDNSKEEHNNELFNLDIIDCLFLLFINKKYIIITYLIRIIKRE